MTDPMTREQFERFDRFSKGGSGYAEKRLVATVRSLYETIDALYLRIEDYEQMEPEVHYDGTCKLLQYDPSLKREDGVYDE